MSRIEVVDLYKGLPNVHEVDLNSDRRRVSVPRGYSFPPSLVRLATNRGPRGCQSARWTADNTPFHRDSHFLSPSNLMSLPQSGKWSATLPSIYTGSFCKGLRNLSISHCIGCPPLGVLVDS